MIQLINSVSLMSGVQVSVDPQCCTYIGVAHLSTHLDHVQPGQVEQGAKVCRSQWRVICEIVISDLR